MGVKYIVTTKNLTEDGNKFKLLYSSHSLNFYENLRVLPRAFIVTRYKIIKEREERLKELLSFAPSKEIILEEEPEFKESHIDLLKDQYDVKITSYKPDRVEIKVNTKKNGFLVLTDVYYPGWKVFVDNKESKIYKTNHTLRSVYLTEGYHNVVFVYKPLSFYKGLSITLFTLLVIFIYLLVFIFKQLKNLNLNEK